MDNIHVSSIFLQGKHRFPPPWLVAMQRYGPPPSYPNLKIPGLNSPIPEVSQQSPLFTSLSTLFLSLCHNCRAAPLVILLVGGESPLLMSGDVPSMETCLVWRAERMPVKGGEEQRRRRLTRRCGESLSQRRKRSRLKR